MELIEKIESAENMLVDMQATVQWYAPGGKESVTYEWAYKKGMEYTETKNKFENVDNLLEMPIQIISYNGEKQFGYYSTEDRTMQRGAVKGLDIIHFLANLMPRILLGYRLFESLSDQLKKAEHCVCSEDKVDGRNCILIEAYNIPIEGTYSQNLKVWIDTERDYRPLKIEVYHNYYPNKPWSDLIRRADRIELEQVDGFWFPSSGYITYFRKGIIRKAKIRRAPQLIKATNIRLNSQLDKSKFTFQFPDGCVVWDDFAKLAFTVGANE